MKGKSKSAQGAHGDKQHELPFVDEMNEVITKEKHLLQLKILEQQREAEEWKAKYMSVVTKVGDSANKTGDYRAMEFLGDVDSTGGLDDGSGGVGTASTSTSKKMKKIEATPEGIQQMLLDLRHKWVLDLSVQHQQQQPGGIKLDLLKAINNEVFSVRGAETNAVSVFSAQRCELDDQMAVTLGSILSKNTVEAVNLSYNQLGPQFFVQLMNAMKSRRKTPQYIDVSGNVQLAGVDLSPILKNFTDSTWGISVSLQDQGHGQVTDGGGGHDAHGGASRKGGASATSKARKGGAAKVPDAVYSSGQEPRKALAFLNHMFSTMNPTGGAHDKAPSAGGKKAAGKAPAKSKGAAAKKGAADAGGVGGTGGIIRTSSITTLSVFGLTCNHLCVESVSKLGEILDVAAPSLTDLDLSFSYIGVNGCKMLKQVLCNQGCQLTRLGLAGNNMSDIGAHEVGLGLRKNRTLTYLDVRSNALEPPGLRSLCYALTGAPLGGFDGKPFQESRTTANNVLSHIDIRGNFLPETSVHASRLALKDWGLAVYLQSGPQYKPVGVAGAVENEVSEIVGYDESQLPYQKTDTYLLFQRQAKSSSEFTFDAEAGGGGSVIHLATLYAIDLKFASTHFLSREKHHLKVEWLMVPAKEITSENGKNSSDTWLNAPSKIGWDILFVTSTASKVVASGTLSPTSDSSWVRCSTLIRDEIPTTGNLVIRARASEEGGARVPIAMASCDCTITSLPSLDFTSEGGDLEMWAPSDSLAVSMSATHLEGSSIPIVKRVLMAAKRIPGIGEYDVLRVMKHGGNSDKPVAGVKVSWASKLVSEASHASSSAHGDVKGLGYEWVVLVEQALQGSVVEVARGECSSLVDEENASNMQESNGDVEGGVLSPWRWSAMSAQLSQSVGCGDNILLLARVKSLFEGSLVKDGSLSRPACSVVVKNCCLMVPDSHRDSNTSEVGVGVFAVHNAQLSMM